MPVPDMDLGMHAEGSHRIAEANSLGRLQGHRDDVRSAESDHFGQMSGTGYLFDFAAFSHRG